MAEVTLAIEEQELADAARLRLATGISSLRGQARRQQPVTAGIRKLSAGRDARCARSQDRACGEEGSGGGLLSRSRTDTTP